MVFIYNLELAANCLKGVSGKVTVDEKGIKDSWKEYMEKLINEPAMENSFFCFVSEPISERPGTDIFIIC